MAIRTRTITGITTTGMPHLGNYVGAIRPTLSAGLSGDIDSFVFLADYHALVKCSSSKDIRDSRCKVAATWLALGLDPKNSTFYCQSDIPEIFELSWILTSITSKNLLNRAHAYKAASDKNIIHGKELDSGISMGLYSYPILMAADILIINANKILVGQDQIQHIEIARSIAHRFNHLFSRNKKLFVLPTALVQENSVLLPGLDGRKMSKSYSNTIPVFAESEDMRNYISRIETDSCTLHGKKNPDRSYLFAIYQAFSTLEKCNALRDDLEKGLSWKSAKEKLFNLLEDHFKEPRERYRELISKTSYIEDILADGASKVRNIATSFLGEIRDRIGMNSLQSSEYNLIGRDVKNTNTRNRNLIIFREGDETFRFCLRSDSGERLLTSKIFSSGRTARVFFDRLQFELKPKIEIRERVQSFTLWLEEGLIAESPKFKDEQSKQLAIETVQILLK